MLLGALRVFFSRKPIIIIALPLSYLALPVFQSIWPSGIYGLPKPKSGCPDESWKKGFRYQDSENVENANLKSNRSHLSGEVTPHGIRQEFCIHLDSHRKDIPWPSGKYCIYRKGGNCPAGLQQGKISCQYNMSSDII